MSIRVIFYYSGPASDENILYKWGKAVNDDGTDAQRYTHYLAGPIKIGIPNLSGCEAVLQAISDVEEGKISHSNKGDNDTLYEISKEQVQISIIAFDEWSYQPEGIFTLEEFKKTVEGWHKFFLLPKTADTQVVICLENSGPDHSII